MLIQRLLVVVIIVSGGTLIGALGLPVLLALRDIWQRRRARRKLPYAARPVAVADPAICADGRHTPCDSRADGDPGHTTVAPGDPDRRPAVEPHRRAGRDGKADIAPAAAPAPGRFVPDAAGYAVADNERALCTADDDNPSLAAVSATPWVTAPSNPDPHRASLHSPSRVLNAAADDGGMVSADDAAQRLATAADTPTLTSPRADAAIARPAVDGTLVAASERAASMVWSTPSTRSMLALLTIEGARDEAAMDALVRAGRGDDAAVTGDEAPSFEQPDEAPGGLVEERDWWSGAVVVRETPAALR